MDAGEAADRKVTADRSLALLGQPRWAPPLPSAEPLAIHNMDSPMRHEHSNKKLISFGES